MQIWNKLAVKKLKFPAISKSSKSTGQRQVKSAGSNKPSTASGDLPKVIVKPLSARVHRDTHTRQSYPTPTGQDSSHLSTSARGSRRSCPTTGRRDSGRSATITSGQASGQSLLTISGQPHRRSATITSGQASGQSLLTKSGQPHRRSATIISLGLEPVIVGGGTSKSKRLSMEDTRNHGRQAG